MAARLTGARVVSRALAPAVCLFALALSGYAQTAATTARPAPNAPATRQAKLQTPGKADAGMHVIAVVHRLSGWKLRALLARPDAPFAATTFDDQFVRTNIVAGYVLPDGRHVVARLPRADAEMLDFATGFRDGHFSASTEPLPLTLVRNDGTEINANFVGLDASTGLSLLEAEQPVGPFAPERAATAPAVGQRVRVIAPVQVINPAPLAPSAVAATPAEGAPVGEAGVIYMNMSEATGQLTQIKRSPTGKAVEFTVEVGQMSPEWAGGVALAETGTLVGIVDESSTSAARLVSAETVRAATARVLARRASVPQPWLGARGTAVALTPLNLFVARGWPEREARTLLERHLGVLLTEVAPGTPAAVAGLRRGDVVARIGRHEVRSVEDMSLMLQELGSNSVANFTVLRADRPPLDLAVRLSEAQNPALETAQAEARAADAEIRLAQSEAQFAEAEKRLAEVELRLMQTETREREVFLRAADAAHREDEARRLREAQERAQSAQRKTTEAQGRMGAAQQREVEARQRLRAAETRIKAASAAHFGLPVLSLLRHGLEAFPVWPPDAARFGAQVGLLVVGVRQESAAARAGVRAGDMIETVNGQPATDAGDWRASRPGAAQSTLTLGVLRDGQKLTLQLPRAQDQ